MIREAVSVERGVGSGKREEVRSPFHPLAWLAWLISAAGLVMLAQNPVASLVLLAVAVWVTAVCGQPDAPFRLPLVKMGGFILLFATIFSLLSVHIGETVWWRLPMNWPWIGGAYTLEAAVAGLANGLLLLALLAIFTTFNQALPTADLVRWLPPALRDLGVVAIIAVTYVPETARQLRQIREAQAIRGHRLRGVADWRPVVLPLLLGGLERALGLAETMVARGYGQTADAGLSWQMQIGLVGSMTAVFGGWLLAFWQGQWGWWLMAAGLVLFLGLVWRLGRRSRRTRFVERPFRLADGIVALTAVFPWLLVVVLEIDGFGYSPFPRLDWPFINPLFILSLLALLPPVFSPHD
ncbi:MAG: energy-coupling factor transporter transmembrane component T [Anaerolineae bacterium]